ncbi:TraM recognition domain-containing protein [Chitinophaga oryziterrae]|uniref:TraM recognition domain-containing protein n=1 Tax=Chitinophaga oryziterrae TaxID=1031224 RepID=A0A6N8JBT1_9BACT|nr:TraM recognition domain-containing protein [Chitinophaga oryziterrae]MVT42414.1 TraM recognition domain-containing protein [Chitinophaga oryziterrae]
MIHDLDTPLFQVADGKGMSPWTIRNAVEGTAIFGGIGSGKTSGSGCTIARKLLEKNFGGLVLTAKPDEKDMWVRYCQEAGRLDDLIIVEPGGQHAFNFLEYESAQRHGGISLTENIVQVLKTVIAAGVEKSNGKSDDPFWEDALNMLIFNSIDLSLLAYGKVSVQDLYDIVVTAPKKEPRPEDKGKPTAFKVAFAAARDRVDAQVEQFLKTLTPEEQSRLHRDAALFEATILEKIPDARTLQFVDQFFVESYRNLSEKTRSIIEFSFSGFLFRLLKEPVHSLFCRRPSTLSPDDCRKGKIVLLNFPVKQYYKVGRDIQVMMKFIFQRAWESRSLREDDHYVFLWADEAQHFLHEHDQEFSATARSAGIATVYLSQNLPNYHANMGGGAKSEYRVKGFLGTLSTKIFHANADIETNSYASDLIGQGYVEDKSRTVGMAGQYQSSQGTSIKLEKLVRPEEFVGLCTGGPQNGKRVSCFIHRQGNKFHNGFNFIEAFFPQD